ncbi:MAG: hypothetical protein IPJ38_21880 [Dechloromonas sp.]|uniref:Uncharacterized protein n=1 Tax=Candidatus Dechloromonas phosphorivorans TaxID=2899244 RepID=A0A935K649_9RHOO|nr:hypothetical protein [Candidatus Dechloromonas phosphorivorans]
MLVMGLLASTAEAVIVVDYSVVSPPPPGGLTSRYVPLAQTEPAYLMQRSNAWRVYNRNDSRTGAMLVYPCQVTGSMGAPTSLRQVEVRNNVSRAHVYRLR